MEPKLKNTGGERKPNVLDLLMPLFLNPKTPYKLQIAPGLDLIEIRDELVREDEMAARTRKAQEMFFGKPGGMTFPNFGDMLRAAGAVDVDKKILEERFNVDLSAAGPSGSGGSEVQQDQQETVPEAIVGAELKSSSEEKSKKKKKSHRKRGKKADKKPVLINPATIRTDPCFAANDVDIGDKATAPIIDYGLDPALEAAIEKTVCEMNDRFTAYIRAHQAGSSTTVTDEDEKKLAQAVRNAETVARLEPRLQQGAPAINDWLKTQPIEARTRYEEVIKQKAALRKERERRKGNEKAAAEAEKAETTPAINERDQKRELLKEILRLSVKELRPGHDYSDIEYTFHGLCCSLNSWDLWRKSHTLGGEVTSKFDSLSHHFDGLIDILTCCV